MKLKITVDGKVYEVEVEATEPDAPRPAAAASAAGPTRPAPASKPAPAPRAAAPKTVADDAKACRSPISGVVVRIAAQVGQQLKANDILMVLEAMKMETVITSPQDGKVSAIHVKVGDPVQGGQVLAEFE